MTYDDMLSTAVALFILPVTVVLLLKLPVFVTPLHVFPIVVPPLIVLPVIVFYSTSLVIRCSFSIHLM